MLRTKTCGELRITNVGQTVTLSGWVQRTRDKGAMVWIDLRDRYGITQLILEEGVSDAAHLALAKSLGREDVIQAEGVVIERSSKNPNIPTGEIELKITSLKVMNKAKTPPFTIEDDTDGGDELRMKYRYLDIRRNPVRSALELRHRLSIEIRKYMDALNFLEIETPYLIKSTPEGARDFVVPSRMNPGEFYALPQSPQTFKQLLMVGGIDRYYQIVKCFRDEDLRADRQPEFTQIDCEMAFVERKDILDTFEGLIKHLFKTVRGVDFTEAFPRMQYAEAMERYGSDKPDLRNPLIITDVSDCFRDSEFTIFKNNVAKGFVVRAIVAPQTAQMPRSFFDKMIDFAKDEGASGLAYIQFDENGQAKGPIAKFFSASIISDIKHITNAKALDSCFFARFKCF